MENFFRWLDDLAETEHANRWAVWLRRAAFVFLLLMTVSLPHSIAATQISWIIGTLLWLASSAFKPRPPLVSGKLEAALWIFFGWTALTAFTSFAPDISIDKLRGAAVFLIFIFAARNIRNIRAAHVLVLALIASCMVNVLWTPVERIFGRGVEIHGLSPEGPLAKALLWEGDTLLEADGETLMNPDDVLAAIKSRESTRIKFYRPDFEFSVDVKRADLLKGETAAEQIGIASWKKSRNWRSKGFYGHYTTYAEVLQLIGSLVFGLFAGWLASRKLKARRNAGLSARFITSPLFPAVCFVGIAFALLLTVTRAAQLAFIISCGSIIIIGLGRKAFVAAVVIAIPVILGGLLFLNNARNVGFFDPNDDSIKWRQTVWSEGLRLWTKDARNLTLGVGMDSVKRFAGEWEMFGNGRLNPGHFHSTPLQLVVERGIPALLLWLIVLAIYARTLWRGLRESDDTLARGIMLGCFGGAVGFVVSGIVHYNLGDQEVAMTFYMLMAIGVRAAEETRNRQA